MWEPFLIQQLVYMVSGGKGKIRAAKNGGLQTTYQWRTVALATGEEPLSTDTTMTGVSTRVLEIKGNHGNPGNVGAVFPLAYIPDVSVHFLIGVYDLPLVGLVGLFLRPALPPRSCGL